MITASVGTKLPGTPRNTTRSTMTWRSSLAGYFARHNLAASQIAASREPPVGCRPLSEYAQRRSTTSTAAPSPKTQDDCQRDGGTGGDPGGPLIRVLVSKST